MTGDYAAFLAGKRQLVRPAGFDVDTDALPEPLYGFQRDIVAWALRIGRSAVFAETGLGKTLMQVSWAERIPGRVLILAPLAVAHQTVREASRRLGIDVRYARSQADAGDARLVIANYEMAQHFDPSEFAGVVLDESGILKDFSGVTTKALTTMFAATPYRLCCSATPAPNDHVELGTHAEFLGLMRREEMLSRWFINDTGRTGTWRLKRHARRDFWAWVASWSVSCAKPSDVGPWQEEDARFDLPPLVYQPCAAADPDAAHEAGTLFVAAAPSSTALWRDKARTAEVRCQAAADIVATKPDVPWIVWCETNHESTLLARLIPEAVEVRGDQTAAEKESRLAGFLDGRTRILVTKASVAGFGLNLQLCADVVFTSLSYSFEKFYQAVRRTWRYGQTRPVTVHVVTAASEAGVVAALERKQQAHETMHAEMVAATRDLWREQRMIERAAATRDRRTGPGWTLDVADAVEAIRDLPDASVHLSVFSPPFADIFVYSDLIEDMGNCRTRDEFLEHFDWLVPELRRVTVPGRLCAVHCSELPRRKSAEGVMGLYDFPGEIVRLYEKHGWILHSRVTIWRDPVVEMTRTKALGLLHKSFASRREACRVGMPDYLLVFRRWEDGMTDRQIQGLADPRLYVGDNPPLPTGDPTLDSIAVWQKYASPVWMDIRQTRVLDYENARAADDERHLCPLQLDVIERAVWLWSNPDDLVLDPFAGIGSTGYIALREGRRFHGVELKPEYAAVAQQSLERAVRERSQGNLFIPAPT